MIAFIPPPPPVWKMSLCKDSNTYFNLTVGPNWFHRKMQRLMLGIVWERLPQEQEVTDKV